LAWAHCECGCGWEGVDDVAQFCAEEAGMIVVDRLEGEQMAEEDGRSEAAIGHEEAMRKFGGR